MIKKISELINPNDEIVLMSLREEYFASMISGVKNYEYRKNYRKIPTKAFIYISKTKKSIVAMIDFDKPIFGTSDDISAISERENPGSYRGMMEYLDRGVGVAIPIKAIYEFQPIPLVTLRNNFEGFAVPQSYYMLNEKIEMFNMLKDQEITNIIVCE